MLPQVTKIVKGELLMETQRHRINLTVDVYMYNALKELSKISGNIPIATMINVMIQYDLDKLKKEGSPINWKCWPGDP